MRRRKSIKELGTNGGGFFNANSAHPFENPTPLTNLFEMWLLLVISAALTYTFGRMVGDTRQGWAIFAAFLIMALAGVFICYGFEQAGNPILAKLGIQTAATPGQAGGNMEGKEVRFGVANSTLWATITTDTSCGAVNSMHDSFLPIAGLVPLLNMMTDIVIFGGVGAGLYGILIYCIVAVFIAGLMVGRTPEYLGKKLEQKEVKMAMLAIIVTSASILVFSALSSRINFPVKGYWNPPGPAIANMNNSGPHGLSEILYAYTSSTGNNGSAFAGITVQHPVVQPDPGIGAADRPVPVPDSDSRGGRQPGSQEKSAGHQRHVPDAWPAVRRAADRNRGHHRRTHVFPGGFAGTDRRTLPDARRQAVFHDPAVARDLELAMPTTDHRTSSISRRSHRTIRRRFCPRSWRGPARCSIRRSSDARFALRL